MNTDLKKTTYYNNNSKFQKIKFFNAYFSKFVFFEVCCFLKFFFLDLFFFGICCFFFNRCCFLKCDIFEICCFSNLLFLVIYCCLGPPRFVATKQQLPFFKYFKSRLFAFAGGSPPCTPRRSAGGRPIGQEIMQNKNPSKCRGLWQVRG